MIAISTLLAQGTDALTKVIVQALMSQGGLSWEEIEQKLICFGSNGIFVFQDASNSCIT
jgi:hypothetical protein